MAIVGSDVATARTLTAPPANSGRRDLVESARSAERQLPRPPDRYGVNVAVRVHHSKRWLNPGVEKGHAQAVQCLVCGDCVCVRTIVTVAGWEMPHLQ